MKFLSILLFTCCTFYGFGQNFYQTTIYDSLKLDPDYHSIYLEQERVRNEVDALFSEIEFSIHEQVILKDAIFYVDNGYDELLVKELEKTSVRGILESYKIDQQVLILLTKKNKPLVEKARQLLSIYSFKKIILPENETSIRELRKYKLENDEVILEIGSGTIEFSKLIGKKVKNCQIYLNELDSLALKRMFYKLNYDPMILKIKETRNNDFYIIQGGERTTGIENKIFDRIIIREAIHHFSEPEAMFQSIKKSMDDHTLLIVRERFSDECKKKCCNYLWSKKYFENSMSKNGFIKMEDKRMRREDGNKFWVYKFKLAKSGE